MVGLPQHSLHGAALEDNLAAALLTQIIYEHIKWGCSKYQYFSEADRTVYLFLLLVPGCLSSGLFGYHTITNLVLINLLEEPQSFAEATLISLQQALSPVFNKNRC